MKKSTMSVKIDWAVEDENFFTDIPDLPLYGDVIANFKLVLHEMKNNELLDPNSSVVLNKAENYGKIRINKFVIHKVAI